jgi:glycosyltransferase involved in cell wall biosynthesis
MSEQSVFEQETPRKPGQALAQESRTRRETAQQIVHVVAQYPPALGGMETAVHAIAHKQHETGIPVQVITSDQGKSNAPIGNEGFPVRRLKSFNFVNTPIMPGLAFRLFTLKRRSIVHLHIAQAYTPELVWLTAKFRRVKYVAHFHADVIPSGRAGLLLEPYKKIVLSRVMRAASKVLVPTEDYRDLVCDKYRLPRDRVAVVDNGTDHRIVEQPKSLSGQGKTAKLLFVGRLAIQKNLPLMLRAVAAYRNKYGTDIELSIVGDGDLRSLVESEIRQLEIGSLVHLTGPRRGGALESMYEESDLFILTSIFESFGLVLVEAMAKALPIVSVYIPAVRNVVLDGVNGLLVESTPEALADAIHRLLTDRDLYAKVSMNNLAASHRYTWGAVVNKISAAYESL